MKASNKVKINCKTFSETISITRNENGYWVMKMVRKFTELWLTTNLDRDREVELNWTFEKREDAVKKCIDIAESDARHAVIMSL